uniref:Inositol hexakisphosphate and diphosphoinositol-pentakisphosphate kinase n=1 Tax=Eutreptiella gymnastica TaxID=73025 RepID=A0A7S4GK18_9EUGL
MSKKVNAKPMKAILARMTSYGDFVMKVFDDQIILEEPVEQWPIVDALISFHSDGFPYEKALQYVELRKPFLINDLMSQRLLFDRRSVYKTLVENGVQVPKHIIVNREGLKESQDPEGFIEREGEVELNGVKIAKPFVEKPADADDHNIYIYYPSSMGGGVKRLFRKVGDKSAEYDPYHPGTIRRDGSYIYETFLATGGTDVKVYTVGPRYAHAEARKSPVVDGKVIRTDDGKELRFPVLLSPTEKEIARMVSLIFGQKVCGFDLLRCRSKSYVCDVNGWSFVKSSVKYYDDAAGILRSIILGALNIHKLFKRPSTDCHLAKSQRDREAAEEYKNAYETGATNWDEETNSNIELRCVLAIVRHGDRTPKQKMKMKVTQPALIALMEKHLDSKGKQAKLKSPAQLQELLDITRTLIAEVQNELRDSTRAPSGEAPSQPATTSPREQQDALKDTLEKLRYMRAVLEQGTFSGVNRKVQLKPVKPDKKSEDNAGAEDDTPVKMASSSSSDAFRTPTNSFFSDPGDKAEQKARKPPKAHAKEALLVLKHGGVLTHSGRQQAEQLGKNFRTTIYPSNLRGGLLRLHSTYRHDLKIYSSDEGRVQSSAAAFAQGLLDLEGSSLTPILVSLIKKDASMLETFGKGASNDIQVSKALLYNQLTYDAERGQAYNVPVAVPDKQKPALESEASGTDVAPKQTKRRVLSASGERSEDEDASENSKEEADQQGGCWSQLLDLEDPSFGSDTKPYADGWQRFHRMSPDTLARCHEMAGLLRNVVDELHVRLQQENPEAEEPAPPTPPSEDKEGGLSGQRSSFRKLEAQSAYNSLLHHPSSFDVESLKNQPYMNEKMILMYDRWRKLLKGFYNDKTGNFDCSKIPDVYDSVKYDLIHNKHLGLDMERLYYVSRKLANCVIPNEYGVDAESKRRIGARICSRLLGKLIMDLDYMVEESLAAISGQDLTLGGEDSEATLHMSQKLQMDELERQSLEFSHAELADLDDSLASKESVDDTEDDSDDEIARLSPEYASGILHPMRHVRTRIYFTSESHLHAIANVLRYAHLDRPDLDPDTVMVGPDGRQALKEMPELDYLSSVVLRLWEDMSLPTDDPARFRVEAMLSPGTLYNEPQPDHCLPRMPEKHLHPGNGVTLRRVHQLLEPFATPCKKPAMYWHTMDTYSKTPKHRQHSTFPESGGVPSPVKPDAV